MAKSKKYLLAILVILICTSFCFGANPTKTISAWIPYWALENGLLLFKQNSQGRISQLNLFTYAFDKDANIILVFEDKEKYKELLKSIDPLNTQITATFTNDIFYSKFEQNLKEPEIVHRILSDDKLRLSHINQILAIAGELNLSGIDIDYENIDIKDKQLFSRFVEELSVAAHKENKVLEVTVQQKTQDHQRSGAGAVDWREISKFADKINIMCYNYSSKGTKPGPICPSYWLVDIIKFAKTQIPVDKICIALPLYGYDWIKENAVSVNIKSAKEIINKFKAKSKWDKKSSTPHFIYYKEGEKHQVWFEDRKSILDKTKLIKKHGISHIAFWHIGFLDNSFLEAIQSFLK